MVVGLRWYLAYDGPRRQPDDGPKYILTAQFNVQLLSTPVPWSWEVKETNSIILFLNGTSQEQVYLLLKPEGCVAFLQIPTYVHTGCVLWS